MIIVDNIRYHPLVQTRTFGIRDDLKMTCKNCKVKSTPDLQVYWESLDGLSSLVMNVYQCDCGNDYGVVLYQGDKEKAHQVQKSAAKVTAKNARVIQIEDGYCV